MKGLFLKILKWKLRMLSRLTLKRYQPGVIGVTGTVGKTLTKEMVGLALKSCRRVRVSPKNFNTEVGLALTILSDVQKTGGIIFWFKIMSAAVKNICFKKTIYPELLVLEYGADRPDDMKSLLSFAKPTIGVLTALSEIPAHIEFFLGPEGVLKEKSKLISQLPATGFAVLNADDPKIISTALTTRAHVITFGFSEKAEVRISNFSVRSSANSFESTSVIFKLNYGGSFVPVRLTNTLSKAAAMAAAAATAVSLIFGLNLVQIAEALSRFQPLPGRLRILKGVKNTLILDDTYNASPLSMNHALETLKAVKGKRKIAVLGDMLELGKYTFEAHQAVGKTAAKTTDVLLTVGLRGKIIAEAAKKNGFPAKSIHTFDNLTEAGQVLQKIIKAGDVIMIKGSQAVRMEKIVKEIMAEPERAEELLVRQDKSWLAQPSLYEVE